MTDNININKKLDEILATLKISTNRSKYLTAKQAQEEFGIPSKTLLNRSKLPSTHKRYIPTCRLSGGRKKYFERKVLERIINTVEVKE